MTRHSVRLERERLHVIDSCVIDTYTHKMDDVFREEDASVTVNETAQIEEVTRKLVRSNRLIRLNLVLTSILIPLFGLGVYLSWGPISQFQNTDPQIDGYVQPRSIETLVDVVQDSTVSVYCEYGPGDLDYDIGSGWALDIETDMEDEYPTALVTNHHVIERCMDGKGKLFVAALGSEEFPAVIDNWDIENDLAIIATKLKVAPLPLSQNEPYPGYWVMAVGTADGYAGSVAFGNVLNLTETEILITAAISGGNSGGPLIDNEGYVVGTNTWSRIGEQYNGAKSLDAMCAKIMECPSKKYWQDD